MNSGQRIVVAVLMQAAMACAGVAQNAPQPTYSEAHKPGTSVRIALVGDSTQTDNAGYGRGFCANLNARVDCINLAKGGSSTKTYRQDGLWEKALAARPDYMLMQFGHNDMESPERLPRQVPIAVYAQNLRNLVTEARAQNIKPVLVTSLTRRYFEKDGKVHSDLAAHADVVRRVASEMRVPLIDLHKDSIEYLNRIGEARGSELGTTKKDAEGTTVPDKTHLNWQGSYVFGRMVAVSLGKAVPGISKYVRRSAAELPAEGVLAMKVFRREPFKIVLVGDSTVAPQGGWGPGFCNTLTPNVTCVDAALNGRSSKSFRDEGAWKKALDEKGQYYFIQFGHNDQKPDPKRHTDAETSFAENLRQYVNEVRANGGIPILVSPLSRRNYKDGKLIEDGLKEYANAARRVAAEERVTFIELLKMSGDLLSGMTQEQADQFNATTHADAAAENGAAVKPDRTHMNERGKKLFGRMVADEVIRREVELGPNVIGVSSASATAAAKGK